MKTTPIKISDNGLFGQAVNIHSEYVEFEGEESLMKNIDYIQFAAANPPYPLTKLGEPSKVVDAVLVWQLKYPNYNKWLMSNQRFKFKDFEAYKLRNPNIETRQAFEAISNKEEITEKDNYVPIYPTAAVDRELELQFPKGVQSVAEQSIEEETSPLIDMFRSFIRLHQLTSKWDEFISYYPNSNEIIRASHIPNSKGLVSKDKVMKIIEANIQKLGTEYGTGIQANKAKIEELTDLLNQIKEP